MGSASCKETTEQSNKDEKDSIPETTEESTKDTEDEAGTSVAGTSVGGKSVASELEKDSIIETTDDDAAAAAAADELGKNLYFVVRRVSRFQKIEINIH